MSTLEKPSDPETYGRFIEDITGRKLALLMDYYENATSLIRTDFCKSGFYRDLKNELNSLNDKYLIENNYRLLDLGLCLVMKIKKFDDMLDKCFRRDILNNREWDTDSSLWFDRYDWAHPLNCFEKLNDVLRTRILLRYLDGVELVLSILKKMSNRYGTKYELEYKADERGYYGVHFVVLFPSEILDIENGTKEVSARIELQLCTQISEVVNELLHEYYERQRLEKPTDKKWQWDFESDEFSPAYIGHISHYIEGAIMQARQKVG